jgi:hypothetical protein
MPIGRFIESKSLDGNRVSLVDKSQEENPKSNGKAGTFGVDSACQSFLNGDIKAVRAHLRGSMSVNVQLPQRKNRPARETPLMLVAKQGYLPIVRLFISLGTNINETNEFRQPSLMYAVRKITYQP